MLIMNEPPSFAFCLAAHSRHCCRTLSGCRSLCFFLATRLRSRTCSRLRSLCLLLGKPTALNALTTAEFLHKAFTDVTVNARHACEVAFEPKLDCCFPADLLHRESALPDLR